MNQRLLCIAAHIPQGRGVIDVGTDHGYLPVFLRQNAYQGRLLASDINDGPLQSAVRTAKKADVADSITFLHCDGLTLCDPEAVDTIVIAGMGGDTICGILDRAEWCMDHRYTLILQPMTRAEVLRYWLIYNEFAILQEDLVEDAGVIYSVIIARFGGKTVLNDAELYIGSAAMLHEHPLYGRFLDLQIHRFEKMRSGLLQSERHSNPGRLELLETILVELKEMKNR